MILEAICMSAETTGRCVGIVRTDSPQPGKTAVMVTVCGPDCKSIGDGMIVIGDEDQARFDAQIMALGYRLYNEKPGELSCTAEQLVDLLKLVYMFK